MLNSFKSALHTLCESGETFRQLGDHVQIGKDVLYSSLHNLRSKTWTEFLQGVLDLFIAIFIESKKSIALQAFSFFFNFKTSFFSSLPPPVSESEVCLSSFVVYSSGDTSDYGGVSQISEKPSISALDLVINPSSEAGSWL